jgi:hypothetical protein
MFGKIITHSNTISQSVESSFEKQTKHPDKDGHLVYKCDSIVGQDSEEQTLSADIPIELESELLRLNYEPELICQEGLSSAPDASIDMKRPESRYRFTGQDRNTAKRIPREDKDVYQSKENASP